MPRQIRELAFAAVLLLLPAPALAQSDDGLGWDEPIKLARPSQLKAAGRLRTSGPGDTTWVGFNPAFIGPDNYWGVGVGSNRPPAGGDNSRRGYWDWDYPVHGDSLQGWWPVRHLWNQAAGAGAEVTDSQRPWWAIEHGNQVNYVINQGAAHKRTFGLTGVWHSDPGGDGTDLASPQPGTNPKQPNWAPLGGSRSAWCGLRAHGDNTEADPITGNPYNVNAQEYVFSNGVGIGTGTSRKFPGYAGQWNQMLYRDIDLTGAAGPNVTITFKVRTRMSTQTGTATATRTGWFDKDPKAVVAGNFIKSSGNPTPPADSFMVYIGNPVEPDGNNTNSNDYVASDGISYDVYDPQHRWFSEVVRAQGGSPANTHYELFTTYGDRDSTVSVSIPLASLTPYGTTARLVFRIHTNRGFDDEGGSNAGAYSSNGAGAAQVDDITVNTGGGAVVFGNFESASDIDNSIGVPATAKWKSTGKPPGVFQHVHDLSSLIYEDLCGPPGAPTRICNMLGRVISMGDHDLSESAGGIFGSPEQERFDAIVSPTINLVTDGPGNPNAANSQGITWNMANATEDYYVFYEIYTGYFNIFTQGNSWKVIAQSYPATQSNGVRCWGEFRTFAGTFQNVEKECLPLSFGLRANGMIRTSNAGFKPDSLRIGLRKEQQCYRFSISSSDCGSTKGGYWDNVSLALIDGPAPALLSVDIGQWLQDTFPANELPSLPGTAAFDTCAALVKSGLNIAPDPGSPQRYDIPGDSTVVMALGDNVKLEMVFRILPGPGNYVSAGSPGSGLRRVPTSPDPIAPGDSAFWTSYLLDNGASGTPGGHPVGPHAARWSELVWNSARCDTTEPNTFPVQARNLNSVLTPGSFMSMYHEADLAGPRSTLGVSRNWCFLNDVAITAPIYAIHCNTAKDVARFGVYPPAWVAATQATNGWNGSLFTTENTKILPDGLFTPGTHVQYFFKRTDLTSGITSMVPDTGHVFPQNGEGPNYDAHRWQSWSVLPDAWKKTAYGGLGQACLLVVDQADRRGDERAWVSIADSIGATYPAKRGAHNGWSAAYGADLNDPAGFVHGRNGQPGTTWDFYNVKAGESLNGMSGTLGARIAYRGTSPTNLIDGQWAKNAPTLAMLEAYYPLLWVMAGDLSSVVFGGQILGRADDIAFMTSWLTGASSGQPRGIWLMGDGIAESLDPDPFMNLLGTALAYPHYGHDPYTLETTPDLIPLAPITTNGDIYGIEKSCSVAPDVLETTGADAVPSSLYEPPGGGGGPFVSGVFKNAAAPNFWISQFDGFSIQRLTGRFGASTLGRRAYVDRVFSNIFSSVCGPITFCGVPEGCTDVPGMDTVLRDFMALRNNPLRSGFAEVVFGLSRADRVEVKIFDIAGRAVRTLADRTFTPGEHTLRWDGTNDHGERLARGVYFTRIQFASRGFEQTRKTIVLH